MSGREFPILRFKAFSGPWGKADFQEIAKGFNYGMNASAVTFNGKDKYIRITDIDDNLNTFSPSPLTSPDGGGCEKYKLNTGDIVFARTGASTGKPYLYSKGDGELFFAGFLIKATITKGNPSFIYQFCKTSTYTRWVSVMSMRSGQPGINAEEYKGLCIPFPDEQEQQKIADFLTSVDTKISQLTEKHRLLKKYKKGVMQQIFSQKIRFKDEDGKAFPGWTYESIGKYLEPHKELVRADTDIPILTSSRTGLYLQERSVINEGDYGVVPLGHFTYRHMSDDLIFKFNVNRTWEKGAVSKEYPVFKTVGMDTYFLEVQLNEGKDFKQFAIQQKQGGTRTRLYFKNLKELKLNLPCLKEQQRISQFLQSIDTKIEGVSEQIEQTKQFKKGLLQQMFV